MHVATLMRCQLRRARLSVMHGCCLHMRIVPNSLLLGDPSSVCVYHMQPAVLAVCSMCYRWRVVAVLGMFLPAAALQHARWLFH
jgi:hypothetical protein